MDASIHQFISIVQYLLSFFVGFHFTGRKWGITFLGGTIQSCSRNFAFQHAETNQKLLDINFNLKYKAYDWTYIHMHKFFVWSFPVFLVKNVKLLRTPPIARLWWSSRASMSSTMKSSLLNCRNHVLLVLIAKWFHQMTFFLF